MDKSPFCSVSGDRGGKPVSLSLKTLYVNSRISSAVGVETASSSEPGDEKFRVGKTMDRNWDLGKFDGYRIVVAI